MRYLSTLFFIVTFYSLSFGQLNIHSIDFQAPTSGSLDHNNALSLGITLKMPEKSKMIELSLLGYGPNGSSYNTSTGSFQTVSYFDTSSNSFISNDRPKYRLSIGDSILTKNQSTYSDGLGIRIGLRSDFTFAKIPFYTNVNASLIGTRLSYTASEYYLVYNGNLASMTGSSFERFDPSFQNLNSTRENKITFTPQLGVQLGAVLSLTDRIKVIPKLMVNLTYKESLYYYPNSSSFSTMSLDVSTAGAVQVSYVLKK